MTYKLLLIISFLLSSNLIFAQSTLSSDELFQQARKSAFDQKDYPKAILLSKEALIISPDNADIMVFLGRVYIWAKQPDSARTQLDLVLKKHPDNEEASFAEASLEYWNDNPLKALQYIEEGLSYHPASNDLLLLKAKILNGMKKYQEANDVIDTLLKKDLKNTEAYSLGARIKEKLLKNKLTASYDFVYFDKQFNDPWHLASLEYSRQTTMGPVAARVNYANRFNTNGVQFEVDAYPRLSKTFYTYVNGGYSSDVSIFPKYRAGFSIFANLPSNFEAEGGFRFLSFGKPTWIYTASLSKYYKNYWFNFRSYHRPTGKDILNSFALNARLYQAGADDYLSLGIGTGLSPDDPRNNILLNSNTYKLRSYNLSAGYRHSFKTFNVFFINLGLINQEYQANTRGYQFDTGVGYIRRF